MKKVRTCGLAFTLVTSAIGSASAVTYYSDNFDTQTMPLGAPPVGHHLSTAGSASPDQFHLVTDPALGGNSLKVDRGDAEGAPVLAMFSNDAAMVAGNVVEFGFSFNLGLIVNAPVQVGAGMTNGSIGRMIFIGVNDKYTQPTDVGRVYYTDLFGEQIITTYKVQKDTWYDMKAVATMAPDPNFPGYMTGTFDFFITKQNEAPVQLADNVQMGYGEIPIDNALTPDWDESTAALLRISKGPFSGSTYYDNIYVRQPQVGLIGDANSDGIVSTLDFNILAGHFSQTGQTAATGDFSGDGTVDSVDFNLLVAHFGEKLAPAPALGSVVPEPMALTCLLPALLVLRRNRR